MKIDINDIFALIGCSMLSAGILVKYDWMIASIVMGSILLSLSIYRAK